MSIQDSLEKALKTTEIVRPRVQPLHTFAETRLPYIFLSESSVNRGDTAVRKGEVLVEKPSLILPFNMPHFEGFEFEGESGVDADMLMNFFLVRGVSFPSMKYNNKTDSLEVYEGRLSKAIDHYTALMQREENVHAGLVVGADDCWPFSLLIFAGTQIMKSADGDIRRLMDDFKRKGGLN